MLRLIFMALFLCLSGCMVYSPSYYSYNVVVSESNTSIVTNESNSSVTTREVKRSAKPIIVEKDKIITCENFILPPANKHPAKPTDEQLAAAVTLEEIDSLLADYIRKLKNHINSERAIIEQAHREWSVRCHE